MTLVLLVACWVGGILLGRVSAALLWPTVTASGILGSLLALAWDRPKARLALACAVCFTLGAARMAWTTARGEGETLQRLNGQRSVSVEGWVCAEPDVRSRAVQVEICATAVSAGEKTMPVTGKLLATLPRYSGVHYGSRLALTGRLETPPSSPDFDYREYLLTRGVRSLMRDPAWSALPDEAGSPLLHLTYRFKDRLRLAVERSLPDPEAGLLNGILLGLGHTLPEELYAGYRRTGLSHIIVISGFNIGLVVQFALALAGRLFHRWRALWASLVAVCLYAVFVGTTPPVTRAAIMAGVCIVAQRLGRRAHLITAVAIASLIMSAANPLILWSVSFQLSFVSTLALALLEPRLASAAECILVDEGRRWLPLLRELLLATISAQVATLPIIWSSFGEVSIVSLLANVLVLPAQGGVMLLGAPVPLAGLLSPVIGRFVGLPAWVLLRWTNLVVEWLARVPWATIETPTLPPATVWAFYGALAVVAMKPRRRRSPVEDGEGKPIGAGSSWRYGLPAAVVLTAGLLAALPDGRLHIYALDVGQGDAILVRTPRGRTLLVDGGPDPLLLTRRLGQVLPFFQRRIDLLVSTHADSDHLGGLIAVTQRYKVSAVVAAPCAGSGDLVRAWQQSLHESGITVVKGVAGTRVDVEPGMTLTVLHPSSAADCDTSVPGNDQSVVCLMEYGAARVLLTGDAGEAVERTLVASLPLEGITLLKVAHHGAATASSEALLDETRPAVALISVGRGNDYGHPSPAVLERLEAHGSKVLRTDELGTVEFVTNGERYWLMIHPTLSSKAAGSE